MSGATTEIKADPLRAVKEAHARGEQIEYRKRNGNWFPMGKRGGLVEGLEYRIAEPEWRDMDEGEVLQAGDEVSAVPNHWTTIDVSIGRTVKKACAAHGYPVRFRTKRPKPSPDDWNAWDGTKDQPVEDDEEVIVIYRCGEMGSGKAGKFGHCWQTENISHNYDIIAWKHAPATKPAWALPSPPAGPGIDLGKVIQSAISAYTHNTKSPSTQTPTENTDMATSILPETNIPSESYAPPIGSMWLTSDDRQVRVITTDPNGIALMRKGVGMMHLTHEQWRDCQPVRIYTKAERKAEARAIRKSSRNFRENMTGLFAPRPPLFKRIRRSLYIYALGGLTAPAVANFAWPHIWNAGAYVCNFVAQYSGN